MGVFIPTSLTLVEGYTMGSEWNLYSVISTLNYRRNFMFHLVSKVIDEKDMFANDFHNFNTVVIIYRYYGYVSLHNIISMVHTIII